jgi:hypothetical protein
MATDDLTPEQRKRKDMIGLYKPPKITIDEDAFTRWLGYLPRLDAIDNLELLVLKTHVIGQCRAH